MTPVLHSTRDYHLYGLRTMGWELTVCNSLYPAGSPCRGILKRNASYGKLLYTFLDRFASMKGIGRILEIGGGLGYLMRDILSLREGVRATMFDLSPYLLEQQRKALEAFQVDYIQGDFLECDPGLLKGFDLAILNENLGDFPALLDVNGPLPGSSSDETGGALQRMLALCGRYDLPRPGIGPFHFNLGAVEAVEKLCLSGIRTIFLCEHSCEATIPAPLQGLVHIESESIPERIGLYGHDEYTIAFSHLQKVAHRCGYASRRGPLADFIEFDVTDKIRSILKAPSPMKDEHEIIKHFIEDLYKYEYLILQRTV